MDPTNNPTFAPKHVYVGVLGLWLLLMVLFQGLGYMHSPGERIKGADSVGYYVYLRSLCFDRDLDFTNEYHTFYGEEAEQAVPGIRKGAANRQDRPGSVWPIGPAILWLPFYAIAHVIVLIVNACGGSIPADGYSAPYQLSVMVAHSFYALLGTLLTVRLLLLFYKPEATFVSVALMMLCTPLTFYYWSQVPMANNMAFAFMPLFLELMWRRGVHWSTALALVPIIMCRYQALMLAAGPVCLWLWQHRTEGRRIFQPNNIRALALFCAICVAALIPQYFAYRAIHGAAADAVTTERFYLSVTRLWKILFDLNHGLFLWHPALLAGVAGWWFFRKKAPVYSVVLLLLLLATTLINAVKFDWWALISFGNRRFLEFLPVFALGVAALYDVLS